MSFRNKCFTVELPNKTKDSSRIAEMGPWERYVIGGHCLEFSKASLKWRQVMRNLSVQFSFTGVQVLLSFSHVLKYDSSSKCYSFKGKAIG